MAETSDSSWLKLLDFQAMAQRLAHPVEMGVPADDSQPSPDGDGSDEEIIARDGQAAGAELAFPSGRSSPIPALERQLVRG